MPWQSGQYQITNGAYTGRTAWTQARDAGENILAERFDAAWSDLADSLALVLTRNGQNAMSANIAAGGNRFTGVGDATARTMFAAFGQVQDGAHDFVPAAGVGGTGDAITLTLSPVVTAFRLGMKLRFHATAANTGATTVAVNGLAAESVVKRVGNLSQQALEANDIRVGDVVEITKNTSNFELTGGSRSFVAPDPPSIPTGLILPYGGATAPSGYLLCDGSNVSRTTYATLYGVIGVSYGAGDGSLTFGLPDMRRSVPVGAGGTGTTVLGNALGNTGGSETHALTVSELPAHTHTVPMNRNTGGATSVRPARTNQGPEETGQVTGSTGGNTAHNNMQPSVVVNYVIKT